MPNENKDWADQCVLRLIDEPVNIHHTIGIVGDVRAARYEGFSRGSAEYVSFVDPDDYTEPGIFQHCIDVLDDNPHVCGVYTLSNVVRDEATTELIHPYREFGSFKRPEFLEIHQLTVMRRKELMFWYDKEYNAIPAATGGMQWVYWSMAQEMPWLALNIIGYNWRLHNNNNHTLARAQHNDDIHRTMSHIKTTWRTRYAHK